MITLERSICWEAIVSVILSNIVYMYRCPIPNGFWDRAISLYSFKIVDKKDILCTVSNTGIYCLSDSLLQGYLYLLTYLLRKRQPPRVAQPTQLLLRRHHDLRSCISVLARTLSQPFIICLMSSVLQAEWSVTLFMTSPCSVRHRAEDMMARYATYL
jgi:hypothetical protein